MIPLLRDWTAVQRTTERTTHSTELVTVLLPWRPVLNEAKKWMGLNHPDHDK